MSKNKKARKWLRILHRDLGFLAVGLTIIYAISGILLNLKDEGEDPAYKTYSETNNIEPGLSPDAIRDNWGAYSGETEIAGIVSHGEQLKIYLKGGYATYEANTGELAVEYYRRRHMVYMMNKLHYNKVQSWTWFSNIFAFIMIFLAVSGFLIVPGKKGIKGRGKWYLLAGILFPILFFLLS